MTAEIVPLLWRQERYEKILICRQCKEVCLYEFPVSMKIKLLHCDTCGDAGHLTDRIPRRKRF